MNYIIKAIVLLILCTLAVIDYKRKAIDVRILIITGPLVFLANLIGNQDYFDKTRLVMVVFSFASLVISHLSKEAIGKGDAYTLIWCSITCAQEDYFRMLMIGCFLSFVVACFYLFKNRKKEIAFIPFLAVGYIFSFW